MMTLGTESLSRILDSMDLDAWQFHPVAESTNDLAMAWAREGAPDGSLVLADAQTAGRGRSNRHWVTSPGTGLAMSLVFRLTSEEKPFVSRFTALSALSLVKALEPYSLEAEVKWPNDILLCGKKVGGVLVEADWLGDEPVGLVVGMGVNVSAGSVPITPLRYQAVSIEDALGRQIDRWELLALILKEMKVTRSILTRGAFIDLWNAHLAFRDQWIRIKMAGQVEQRVKLLGVTEAGSLLIQTEEGKKETVIDGEIVMTAFDV